MPNRFLRHRVALIRCLLAPCLVMAALPALAQGTAGAAVAPEGIARLDCIADPHTLCLQDDRFSVRAAYQLTPDGPSVLARAVRLTPNTGYFWFFDEDNVELIVKVLNGCGTSPSSYWFFAAGLTDVGVSIEVTDLRTAESRTYTNPVGTPFAPIQDTSTFTTCP